MSGKSSPRQESVPPTPERVTPRELRASLGRAAVRALPEPSLQLVQSLGIVLLELSLALLHLRQPGLGSLELRVEALARRLHHGEALLREGPLLVGPGSVLRPRSQLVDVSIEGRADLAPLRHPRLEIPAQLDHTDMDEVARSADRVDLILELLDVRLAERLLVLLQRTMRLVQSPRPLLEPLRDRPLQPIDGGGARRVDHLLPGALLLDGVAHGTRQLLAHLALLLVEEAIDPLRLREPRCVGAAAPCGVGSRDDLQHDLRIGSLERVGIPLYLLEAGLDGGLVLGEPAPLDRQPVRIPGGVGRLSRGG